MGDTAPVVYRSLGTEADADAAHRFFVQMLDEQFAATFSQSALTAYRQKYDRELFQQRCLGGQAVLMAAFDGDAMVGLVIGGVPNGGVASLDWVVVAPGYQGRGLGQQLVRASLDDYQSRGAHKVVLYTDTTQGRDFYSKCGMFCEGVHPWHWWGLTHYCMGYVFPESDQESQP